MVDSLAKVSNFVIREKQFITRIAENIFHLICEICSSALFSLYDMYCIFLEMVLMKESWAIVNVLHKHISLDLLD